MHQGLPSCGSLYPSDQGLQVAPMASFVDPRIGIGTFAGNAYLYLEQQAVLHHVTYFIQF